MKSRKLIGRILYALPFLFFGINHFIEIIPLYDPAFVSFIPLGPFTILMTGLLLIIASVGIILNKYIKPASILLAVLLFLFIVTIHIPHLIQGIASEYAMINLLKDVALLGGSIMLSDFFTVKTD